MDDKNMPNDNNLHPNLHQYGLGLELHKPQQKLQQHQEQLFRFPTQRPQHQSFQVKPITLHPNPPHPSPSPWQRMKWTDTMVRVLIMVVYLTEESSSEHPSSSGEASGSTTTTTTKKKPSNPQQAQKKGKWKSVSGAMIQRGYIVAPQQCEDKFNDLNKRYKRLNDIIGKGMACKVVENNVLLEEIDGLCEKDKEEVRKLLSSKHLFYREMYAYHTNCEMVATSSSGGRRVDTGGKQCSHASPLERRGSEQEEGIIRDVHEDDDKGYDDDDVEEEEEEEESHTEHRQYHFADGKEEEEEKKAKTLSSGTKKRQRTSLQPSSSPVRSPPISQVLELELTNLNGSLDQQIQWLRRRAAEVEEKKVAYQQRALELERQRFKWQRFSGNKDREIEKMKLDNEGLRLENVRMLLLLRQKELDIEPNMPMPKEN